MSHESLKEMGKENQCTLQSDGTPHKKNTHTHKSINDCFREKKKKIQKFNALKTRSDLVCKFDVRKKFISHFFMHELLHLQQGKSSDS